MDLQLNRKMKTYLPLVLLIVFSSCKPSIKKESIAEKPPKTNAVEQPSTEIKYPEKVLVAFMDSIAQLPLKPLMDKVDYPTDSLFKSQENIGRQLTQQQFKKLKLAIKSEQINIGFAESIFGKFPIDTMDVKKGKVTIQLFSFDKNKTDYNEFAVVLGWPQDFMLTNVYFLKGDKLLSRIALNFRYELEIKNFRDSEGKTVVYYKQNYESGSGIWWYNYYFYKYDGEKFIPVLNELENANMTWPGFRNVWLESTIVNTNPLTLKMVYHQRFDWSLEDNEKDDKDDAFIVNDSTFVKYDWDQNTKTFVGDYAHSKISKAEILTYYLEENEFLFIKTHYRLLQLRLANKNQKAAVLDYLNGIKNRH